MNISALASLPGSMLWLYGSASIFLIVLGLIMYRRDPSKRILKSATLANWRSEAEHWHVPEAALTDFASSLNHFMLLVMVGVGLGSFLFTVVYALLLMSPAWSVICPFSIGAFQTNAWGMACIMGGSGGGMYGLHTLRRKARSIRDGGPQRSLRDYRSPLFFFISGAWFVLFGALVFAFHLSYLPLNDCLESDFPPRPWQGGVISPWLIFAFVAFLCMEFMLSRIGSAHSPLVPTQVPDAGAIDDMFRGKLISMVQFVTIMLIIIFSASSSMLLKDPYDLIGPLFPLLGLFAGVLLLSSPVGLGGKLTSWFWKRKRTV